jgi:hypothetical protein
MPRPLTEKTLELNIMAELAHLRALFARRQEAQVTRGTFLAIVTLWPAM